MSDATRTVVIITFVRQCHGVDRQCMLEGRRWTAAARVGAYEATGASVRASDSSKQHCTVAHTTVVHLFQNDKILTPELRYSIRMMSY